MLNSLKQTGRNLGREIGRAWDSLSEGWRELLSRSGDALTHFARHEDEDDRGRSAFAALPQWSLLAGELEETDKDVLVRIEVPGMDKEDCYITIEGNMLHVSGEKRFSRERHDSTYHLMERAYGSFQRSFPLPRSVNVDLAEASFRNGVLTVRLPKEGNGHARSISVN